MYGAYPDTSITIAIANPMLSHIVTSQKRTFDVSDSTSTFLIVSAYAMIQVYVCILVRNRSVCTRRSVTVSSDYIL